MFYILSLLIYVQWPSNFHVEQSEIDSRLLLVLNQNNEHHRPETPHHRDYTADVTQSETGV
jgi:hypothetical protein